MRGVRLTMALAAAFAMVAGSRSAGSASPVSSSTDWPQFHDGPAHDGLNRSEHTLGRSNVGTLIQAWSIASSDYFGAPIVVGDTVLVKRDGGRRTKLLARDRLTGRLLWSQALSDIVTDPVAADGVVYVGARLLKYPFTSCRGRLFAFDAASGTELWNRSAPCPGALTVDRSRIYVSGFTDVAAVSRANGALLWDTDVHGFPTLSTVGDGHVFAASLDGNLYALNAATGAPGWAVPAQNASFAPAYADGVVYVGVGSGLQAIDALTGSTRWTYTTPAQVSLTPAIAGGAVFFGDYLGDAFAVRASDGSLVWERDLGGNNLGVSGSPAVANGVVYLGTDRGRMYGLNTTTGRALWVYALEPGSPAVVNAMVFVADRGGPNGPRHLEAFALP